MFRMVIILLSLAAWGGSLSAQTTAVGSVRFLPSPEVERVIQSYINSNRASSTIRGWRVQILSTTDRERMEQTRNNFRQQYPYLPVSWIHNRPYYMVRVGAFADQRDALRIQQLIKPYYPSAYLIQDNEIKITELLDSF